MRVFDARETHRLAELDGINLAGFWQRAVAFLIDAALALLAILLLAWLGAVAVFLWRRVATAATPRNAITASKAKPADSPFHGCPCALFRTYHLARQRSHAGQTPHWNSCGFARS
jgi:uncharacterized RDD family membrane protein YckC